MKKISNLILIGGNGRNIGKTTLATGLITRLSENNRVLGLKVTSMYPGDDVFHGEKDVDFSENVQVFEESNINGSKDTSRMLVAGAEKVLYIQVKDYALEQAAEVVFDLSREYDFIVCESSSLRKILLPGRFILVKNPSKPLKESFKEIENYADTILNSTSASMEIIYNFISSFNIKKEDP